METFRFLNQPIPPEFQCVRVSVLHRQSVTFSARDREVQSLVQSKGSIWSIHVTCYSPTSERPFLLCQLVRHERTFVFMHVFSVISSHSRVARLICSGVMCSPQSSRFTFSQRTHEARPFTVRVKFSVNYQFSFHQFMFHIVQKKSRPRLFR